MTAACCRSSAERQHEPAAPCVARAAPRGAGRRPADRVRGLGAGRGGDDRGRHPGEPGQPGPDRQCGGNARR
ncbi:hypothetical protein G6F46_015282 [Rhizopus delemar]|nr:hypothetical protein G6F23_015424 [Rhizopus arrhizus]KAG1582042.1 hypothetical protein G6F46_015282 [Rhizopus delemar]